MSEELYMKNFNGDKIFSLEYDKETLRDMVLDLQNQLQQKENIIKEVREYIENAIDTGNCTEDISYENGIEKGHNYYVNSKDILQILDKEVK